jgi:hypothetical protein
MLLNPLALDIGVSHGAYWLLCIEPKDDVLDGWPYELYSGACIGGDAYCRYCAGGLAGYTGCEGEKVVTGDGEAVVDGPHV